MDFSPILPPKRHKSRKRKKCKCKESPEVKVKKSRPAKEPPPAYTEKVKRKYRELTDRQMGAITKDQIILRPTFLKNELASMFSKGRKSSTVTKVENYCESYAAREEGNLVDLLRGPKNEGANKENITPPDLKKKSQQPLIKDFLYANNHPSPVQSAELSVVSTVSSKLLSASSRASVASQEVQHILNTSATVPDYVHELTKLQRTKEEPEDFVLNRILGTTNTESSSESVPRISSFSPCIHKESKNDNLDAFMSRILHS